MVALPTHPLYFNVDIHLCMKKKIWKQNWNDGIQFLLHTFSLNNKSKSLLNIECKLVLCQEPLQSSQLFEVVTTIVILQMKKLRLRDDRKIPRLYSTWRTELNLGKLSQALFFFFLAFYGFFFCVCVCGYFTFIFLKNIEVYLTYKYF